MCARDQSARKKQQHLLIGHIVQTPNLKISSSATPAGNTFVQPCWWGREEGGPDGSAAAEVSDTHVGVHLAKGVAHGGEVAAQVLHHVLDAAGVFEQVNALRVRVVVDRERPLDRLGKLPVRGRGLGWDKDSGSESLLIGSQLAQIPICKIQLRCTVCTFFLLC